MSEGGEVAGVLGSVAEETAFVEGRLKKIRDSFDFANAVGGELDERVRDFPGAGMARAQASAASGPAVAITFTADTVPGAPLLVPAGTVYGRSDDTSVQYVQTSDVTIPAAQLSYPNATQTYIPVTSTITGTRANVPTVGLINTLISGPDALRGAAISSGVTLTNAADRETDAELIARGYRYLSSLARTLPKALEFLALSFKPSDGSRIRHAKLYEDPTRAPYTELVVDATPAYRKATATSGTIPVSGQAVLYHEHPAIAPIDNTQFEINGAPAPLDPVTGAVQWVSVPERGHLFPNAGLMSAGDTWTIGSVGFVSVYQGPIQELQDLIEGDLSNPLSVSGWRPAGGRVRVVPPTIQKAYYHVNIVVEAGTDATIARTACISEAIAFSEELAPGDTLYVAALLQRLLNAVDGLINVTLNALMADAVTTASTTDTYAASPRNSVRLTSITFEVT